MLWGINYIVLEIYKTAGWSLFNLISRQEWLARKGWFPMDEYIYLNKYKDNNIKVWSEFLLFTVVIVFIIIKITLMENIKM